MAVPLSIHSINLAMIYVYMVMTPLVIFSLGRSAVLCPVFTAVSVGYMVGLDITASGWETPLGCDPNDLPVHEMQSNTIRILILGFWLSYGSSPIHTRNQLGDDLRLYGYDTVGYISLGRSAALCPVFTAVSVVCMVGLGIIASELVTPFGSDPNDLPVYEMQSKTNRFLIVGLEKQFGSFKVLPSLRVTSHCAPSADMRQLQTL